MSERIEGATRALGMAPLKVDRLVAGPSRSLSNQQSSKSELLFGGRLEYSVLKNHQRFPSRHLRYDPLHVGEAIARYDSRSMRCHLYGVEEVYEKEKAKGCAIIVLIQ